MDLKSPIVIFQFDLGCGQPHSYVADRINLKALLWPLPAAKKEMFVKLKKTLAYTMFSLLTLLSLWGCGSKEPTETEKKKELTGQPGKSFDPNSVPPEYKAGFEKWQQGNGSKVSGPVNATGSTKP